MKIRWMIVLLPVVSVIVISVLVREHAARTASPQTPPGIAAVQPASLGTGSSIALAEAIPDTTSAINSPAPMSQRVVHYEIDARYDAAKHTVDATEILTYHNLTGQALDHFPFHLYQNAFQPKATWVREAKVLGNRDTSY